MVDYLSIEDRANATHAVTKRAAGVMGPTVRAMGRLDRRFFIGLHALLLAATGLGALALAQSALVWEQHLPAPWVVVSGLFFLVEATALHIEIRRETHTLSLSGLPLLLGLLSLSPVGLVAARLVGNGAALVLVRHRYGLKLAWNLALSLLDTATAALIAGLALRDGPPSTMADWLILLGAVLAAELIGLISVPIVIMIADGEIRPLLFTQIGRSQFIAAVSATFGVVAAAAMLVLPWLVVFAAVPLVAVGWLLRSFGDLGKQHHDLQQLHGFTTAIAGRDPVDAGLQQLTTILRASAAAIAVRSADGTFNVIASRDLTRSEHTVAIDAPVDPRGGVQAISADGQPTATSALLAHLGGRRGLAIGIADHAGGSGFVLLIDRLGASETFTDDEARLFGSLATNLASRISADHLLGRLEVQASTDALTGLANRNAIEAELDRRIAVDSSSGAVMLLDLDRFKDVNDSLGHQFGDALLRLMADRLRDHLRSTDLAGRLGGDEFAVVIDIDATRDLPTQLASLAGRLAAPVTLQGITLEVGSSIGVARWPEDATDSTELLRLADIAMYEAKRTHQSWFRYDASIDHASAERLALLGQVRDAVRNRDLRIHLQPQIRPHDGVLVGAEALLRWHHPEQGMIPPGQFLPLAEQSSLSATITDHVINEAIAAALAVQTTCGDITVWVNLAARDLLDESLAPRIAAAVLGAGIEPHQLGFELTESSLIINLEMAITTLAAIRQLGCRTAIDDFGTGFASLQYLQRLPIDEVKIDQSFINDVATNPESAAIVRSTTRLMQDLGKSVVAEGVEDQATLDLLTTLGCDVAQGYHISRPIDVAAFVEWAGVHRGRPVPSR